MITGLLKNKGINNRENSIWRSTTIEKTKMMLPRGGKALFELSKKVIKFWFF